MKLRAIVAVLAGVCLTISSVGAQQMTIEQAREEGKAFGNAKRGDESLVPNSEAQAQAVPGYSGTNQPQSTYFDDPDALIAAGTAQRSTNESYRTVTDADRTRPAFSNAEILATTSRATSIENDPSAYLADENIGSTTGQCQPLPPGSGAGGYYEATCNQGTKLEEVPRSCSIRMAPEITKTDAYKYFVVPDSAYGTPFARYSSMAPPVAAGTCKPTGVAMQACAAHRIYGVSTKKFCDDYYATEYVCSQNLRDIALLPSPITGEGWHEKTVQTSVTVNRVDGCAEMAADAMCTAAGAGEVCSEGPETRIIDGVPVTQAYWAWKRDFTCNVMSAGNDCGDLDANRQCTFLREDCLDDPQQGACKVKEKVYRCPTPDTPTSNAPQYICGDDVYCINGDCEPITLRHGTTDTRSSDSSSTASSGVRDEHSNGSGATSSDGTYDRSGVFSRASTTSSSSLTHEQALARARSYTETARQLEELSQQLSRDASYAETHGMQLSENMSQDLAQWYRAQQASNPGLDAPELWATDLGDHQRAVRQEMVTRWMREKQDDIREEIAGKLQAPDLVEVSRPSIDRAADVVGSYRPHGVSGIPSGPAGGDPRAAGAIIDAGGDQLEIDRGAAQAARTNAVQGSLGVQQEVHSDHNRGFFNDPKLRE